MNAGASPLRPAIALAFVCALLGLAGASLAPAAALDGSYEGAATRIEVRLTDRLSSQDAKPGDIFHFDTVSSVLIAGRFLPAETHGHGVVLEARSGRGQRSGQLELAVRSLDPPDGEPVEVGLEPGQLGGTLDRNGPAITVPPGGDGVAIGVSRATNVVYEKGTHFFIDAPPPQSPPAHS
jgi:hypothetical protein